MWGISFWVFPVVSGFVWLGMLIAMLVVWNVEGRPHYDSMDPNQDVAYISDVGAQGLKPLFVAGSCVTTIFLDLSFASERWLRHRGRLARNQTLAEKILSGLSIVFAIIGTAGLILLSIFDTLRHPQLHDIFLLLFIAGFIISAIFICWAYQRLGIKYRQHQILRMSFWIKLSFILVEVVLAISFGACNFKKATNVAAVLEWAIAFIFTFYVFSFFIDLLPAVRSKHHTSDQTVMQMEQNDDLSNAHSQNQYHSNDMANGHYTHNEGNGYVTNGVHYSNSPKSGVTTSV